MKYIVFALAYFVATKIGLLITISPTGASPFWPASGIALAACYLYGTRLAVAIFLGAFSAQFYNLVLFSSQDKVLESLFLALILAGGATLQAILGAWSIKKTIPKNDPFIEDSIIVRFLTLGVLSCLISPTLGTLIFFLKGLVSNSQVLLTWLTWWMGDSIGVLIFTPLLLIFLASPRGIWKTRIKTVTIPLTITLIFIFGLFLYIKNLEQNRLNTLFMNKVLPIHKTIENNLKHVINSTQITKALFDSSKMVTREEFHILTKSLLKQYKKIAVLEWIPRITDDKRAKFESETGSHVRIIEKNINLKIVPATKAKEYFPILFLEPYESNKKALGFNVLSNPKSTQILAHIRQSKTLSISDPLYLIQDKEPLYSYVTYAPVYQDKQRNTGLLGVTASIFRMKDVIDSSLKSLDSSQLALKIMDDNQLVYSKGNTDFHYSKNKSNSISITETIVIANKKLTMSYIAIGNFYSIENSWRLWWMLIGGFSFCSFMGIALLMLTGRTLKTEQVVKTRTLELSKAQQELSTKNDYLVESLRETKHANEAKSLFLANMSHEIRTPMNAIMGFTEILKRIETDDKKAGYLQTIQTSGNSLLNIINDILDLSKIEAGKMELQYTAVSIPSLFAEIDGLFSQKIQDKGLLYESNISDCLPETIVFDENRLRQMLINLIGNAIKFTHQGFIKLAVSCQTPEESKLSRVNLIFTVSDSGIGIPKAQQQQIFNSFSQVEGQKETLYGGTGLGLSITKRIMDLVNGTVSVDSEEGVGTRFNLLIPDIEVAALDAKSLHPEPINIESIRFKPPRH